VVRLVFGLGTRAVDRTDDDYTRVVALNLPERQPEAGFDDAVRYAQRKVDVLDLGANQLTSLDVSELVHRRPDLPLHLYVSSDDITPVEGRRGPGPVLLTFKGLFAKTTFVQDLREMLQALEEAYQYPVDVEFAINVFHDGRYRLNLLQCRPFQVREDGASPTLPHELPEEHRIIETAGPVIGRSRVTPIDRVVYVAPSEYANLSNRDRFAVARLIGKITQIKDRRDRKSILLVGPGRWGTTTPTLGVPVSTAEINNAIAVCEIVAMQEGFVPDVSLGTHFFNDLVETDMIYFALFPKHADHFMNVSRLESSPNRLPDLLPGAEKLGHVVRVLEAKDLASGGRLLLYADSFSQKVVFCVEQIVRRIGETSGDPVVVL
jgi:hypothetical protein